MPSAGSSNPLTREFTDELRPRSIDRKVQYLQVCVRWKKEAFAVKASSFQEGARVEEDLSLEVATFCERGGNFLTNSSSQPRGAPRKVHLSTERRV